MIPEVFFEIYVVFIDNNVKHYIIFDAFLWRNMYFVMTWRANPKITNDLIEPHRCRWWMTLNHKYFSEKSFVMLYTLKLLLGLQTNISFLKDVVETFDKIIKIRTFLLIKAIYKKMDKSFSFPSTIHLGTVYLYSLLIFTPTFYHQTMHNRCSKICFHSIYWLCEQKQVCNTSELVNIIS